MLVMPVARAVEAPLNTQRPSPASPSFFDMLQARAASAPKPKSPVSPDLSAISPELGAEILQLRPATTEPRIDTTFLNERVIFELILLQLMLSSGSFSDSLLPPAFFPALVDLDLVA